MDILADLFCDEGWLQIACESILFLMCGFDPDQVNETLLDTIVHHTPAGTSTFTVLQYAQEVTSGKKLIFVLHKYKSYFRGKISWQRISFGNRVMSQ
jgi:hypothetical protein